MRTGIPILATIGLAVILSGCDTTLVWHRSDADRAVLYNDEPPAYVEEGALYDGTVVEPSPYVDDYVHVGDNWYYWHPDDHVWVHAHRPENWRPRSDARVYTRWSEHPMYRRH